MRRRGYYPGAGECPDPKTKLEKTKGEVSARLKANSMSYIVSYCIL